MCYLFEFVIQKNGSFERQVLLQFKNVPFYRFKMHYLHRKIRLYRNSKCIVQKYFKKQIQQK